MCRIALLISLFSLLLLLLVAGNCLAQATESELRSASDDSIARLAEALETLTRQLESRAAADEQSTELRKLDIAIAYLNFRSRRIESLERELSMIRNERSRLEDASQNWRERQEYLATELEDKTGDEKLSLQRNLQDLTLRIKNFDQRLARLEEEIIVRENRILELQDELDSVETYVQQHLKM